jgi:hypothetical protein
MMAYPHNALNCSHVMMFMFMFMSIPFVVH